MFAKLLLPACFVLFAFTGFSQDVFEAARTGNLKQLKTLAKIDKDTVNAVNAMGFNPLMIACYRGQVDAAKLLVAKGADVNARSPEGSALQAACYTNNTELTTFLVKKGADIHVSGPDGNNTLMYAVLNQNEALVRLLVKKGADLSAKNKDGQTAYSLAMTQENTAIRELVRITP
jgi:uncharacterized protein